MSNRRRRNTQSTTDPRTVSGGAIAGPGGPFDHNAVVVDTTNSVLLDATHVAIAEDAGPDPIVSLLMSGRVNKSPDRVDVMFLMNEDGAAAVLTELIGLAGRGGIGEKLLAAIEQRLAALPTPESGR